MESIFQFADKTVRAPGKSSRPATLACRCSQSYGLDAMRRYFCCAQLCHSILWRLRSSAFFQAPAGAEIKIRYSGWWFGVDRQRQTLDGNNIKRLVVSPWSIFTARIQMRVKQSTNVSYGVEPGDVAVMPPSTHF